MPYHNRQIDAIDVIHSNKPNRGAEGCRSQCLCNNNFAVFGSEKKSTLQNIHFVFFPFLCRCCPLLCLSFVLILSASIRCICPMPSQALGPGTTR